MRTPSESVNATDNRAQCKLGRVLAVTSSFPRWEGDSSGPFVLNLAQDLQACGWQVDVLAPHAPGAKKREELAGVRVNRFRYLWPSALETLCYGGGILGNLRHNRLNLLKVPPLILGEWAALMLRLAGRRYDVVHSHWLVPQGLVATLAARTLRVPHITTVHGSEVHALRGRAISAVNRFVLRRADAVTVNSAATRAAVERITPGLRQVRTIPMGIATDYAPDKDAVARIRARYRRGSGPLLVLVGRVVREKGVGDFIEALARLASGFSDVSAMIVGEGADSEGFRQLAAERGVAKRIAFVGQQSPEQAMDHMAAADVFVGPSWLEAFGLVFAESLHVGTPVVGTAVGGIGECVINEKTGLLVAPQAPEEIVAAVQRFVTDPSFARRTVRAGRAMVVEKLSREVAASAFSELFRAHARRPDRVRQRVVRTTPDW